MDREPKHKPPDQNRGHLTRDVLDNQVSPRLSLRVTIDARPHLHPQNERGKTQEHDPPGRPPAHRSRSCIRATVAGANTPARIRSAVTSGASPATAPATSSGSTSRRRATSTTRSEATAAALPRASAG